MSVTYLDLSCELAESFSTLSVLILSSKNTKSL